MGADKGVPYMANDAGAKAYVQSLAEALHVEWKPLGVHVTVLPPGPTDTPVIEKFGLLGFSDDRSSDTYRDLPANSRDRDWMVRARGFISLSLVEVLFIALLVVSVRASNRHRPEYWLP
jgi:NAD(P)-dependent dehydrogenase (short-subunit alcohol dehydrogenase family)